MGVFNVALVRKLGRVLKLFVRKEQKDTTYALTNGANDFSAKVVIAMDGSRVMTEENLPEGLRRFPNPDELAYTADGSSWDLYFDAWEKVWKATTAGKQFLVRKQNPITEVTKGYYESFADNARAVLKDVFASKSHSHTSAEVSIGTDEYTGDPVLLARMFQFFNNAPVYVGDASGIQSLFLRAISGSRGLQIDDSERIGDRLYSHRLQISFKHYPDQGGKPTIEFNVVNTETNTVEQHFFFPVNAESIDFIAMGSMLPFTKEELVGYCNEWKLHERYYPGDVVRYQNVAYRCKAFNISSEDNKPGVGGYTNPYWDDISEDGNGGFARLRKLFELNSSGNSARSGEEAPVAKVLKNADLEKAINAVVEDRPYLEQGDEGGVYVVIPEQQTQQ